MATAYAQLVHQVRVPGGPTYPLRKVIVIYLLPVQTGYRARSRELDDIPGLAGAGRCRKLAMNDFALRFHELVEDNRLPLHERSDANQRVNRALDRLIDWERYRFVNPVNQPLWGQVAGHNKDGTVTVRWFLGPLGKEGAGDVLTKGRLHRSLRDFGDGTWFYASGIVYPDRIIWTKEPEPAPDPGDKAAVKAAWDLIPVEVMADTSAWPLKP